MSTFIAWINFEFLKFFKGMNRLLEKCDLQLLYIYALHLHSFDVYYYIVDLFFASSWN